MLEDAEQSDRLLTAMTAAFEENDAPRRDVPPLRPEAVPEEGGINDCTPSNSAVLGLLAGGACVGAFVYFGKRKHEKDGLPTDPLTELFVNDDDTIERGREL